MDRNLSAYIYHQKSFLSKEETGNIINELSASTWNRHAHADQEGNMTYYEDELEVTQAIKSNQIIIPKIWQSLSSYMRHYNFSWFNSWNGFTPVRFNKYSEGKTMHLHWDYITNMFDGTRRGVPTLTVLGLLNDDYKGGEFMMFDDEEIKMDAGEIIIFPSTFMYPHYVKPVTEGVRYSFVSWVW